MALRTAEINKRLRTRGKSGERKEEGSRVGGEKSCHSPTYSSMLEGGGGGGLRAWALFTSKGGVL